MRAHRSSRTQRIVLILGSAPSVLACRDWPRHPFSDIVAINNAWAVRPDWDFLAHPEDFPKGGLPPAIASGQQIVTYRDYVPAQNRLGGFVYAGGTMAFTAGYWALVTLSPAVLAFFGCDMVYPREGRSHFYGNGAADPLRDDVSLRNLAAKSLRLHQLAARAGCHAVNLSAGETRLALPRATVAELPYLASVAPSFSGDCVARAEEAERRLGYYVPSGRYWEHADEFDPDALDRIDRLWLQTGQATATAK